MQRVKDFLELIKFEHTIFALPFAYVGMLLAADALPRFAHPSGWPTWTELLWITVAMGAARTLAMGFNRLVDRALDARNPRTASRPLVTGKVTLLTAASGTAISGLFLVVVAWRLGPLPLLLLPGALLFLLGYSYTKRFTWMSHFILGFTDGLAPMGAWVAVRASLFTLADWPAWALLAAVTLWIGGFDLIYACQDVDFDRAAHLKSIPARFGIATALRWARFSHVGVVALLALLGWGMGLSWPYWLAWSGIIVLLVYEHRLVSPDDLSRVNLAFFTMNGYISILFFLGVLGALLNR
ncbi:MAG: UbiA family prenyltransferase [Anaerolineae bacterium]|nr:UbiA family prenyltransferase [Anaerolineae bacterium]